MNEIPAAPPYPLRKADHMMSPASSSLPRLAYVGEVPVRNISAGPALLYRLLETYPPDRLLIAESSENAPQPDHELPVQRERFHLLNRRIMRTRFARAYGAWVFRRAPVHGRRLAARLHRFQPEAVLSVAHGFGWLAAAAAARTLQIPLHLIVHDHWRSYLSIPPRLNAAADRVFAATYRGAASRLPVSPEMEALYRERYGAAGVVVYPSRSAHAVALASPPLRPPQPGAFVFAYAGSAPSAGQRRTLADFANATAGLGVRLRIYQALKLEELRAVGLRTDNVDIVPFRPVDALHRDLIASADAMYLPMSFAPEDRENVELCFPSKLTDYTVAGLPILVRSPAYGTAAHWAETYPQAAALITTESAADLTAGVRLVIEDIPYRHALAHGALAIGHRLFSQASVFAAFCNAIQSRPDEPRDR